MSYTSLVSDRWGVELSGGYWSRSGVSKLFGIEGGVVYRVGGGPKHFSVLFCNVGHSEIRREGDGELWTGWFGSDPGDQEDKRWTYVGLGLIYKWRALYTEVGLSGGSGSFTTPQLIGQVGITLVTFKKR